MDAAFNRLYTCDQAYSRSYQAFVRGDYQGAAAILETLCGKTPENGALLNDLGVCYYLTGEKSRSRETLEFAVRQAGRKASAEVNLFYLFNSAGFTDHDRGIALHRYHLPVGLPSFSQELVSIIILEYNNPKLTLECLDSLRTFRPCLPFEVILIDNSDKGPSPDYRQLSGIPEIRYLKNERNVGFAGGCNQGARLARGTLLYFVNNDTRFQKHCVEELARVLVADPQAGIAGSKLLYGDGTVQHAGIMFSHLDGSPEHRCRHRLSDDPHVNLPLKLQAVTGASMMVRQKLFRDLGGFSEAFRNGYEDVDLCLKAVCSGFRVIYNPRSVLYHLESTSPHRTSHEEANLRLFGSIWGRRIRRDQLDYLCRNDHFLLSYTDNPTREQRRRQLQRLWLHLLRRHPDLTGLLPLHCVECYKHLRIQKVSFRLFSFLVEQGKTTEAKTLFTYFLLHHGYRAGYVRRMRNALRQHRS